MHEHLHLGVVLVDVWVFSDEWVHFEDANQLGKGLVNEDDANKGGEDFLGEPRHLLHDGHGFEGGHQQPEDGHPEPDPDSQR